MRFTQVGKIQPLMGWHQAIPSHSVQPPLWVQSSPSTQGWDTCSLLLIVSVHLWKDYLEKNKP